MISALARSWIRDSLS